MLPRGIAIGAVVTAITVLGVLQWRSRQHVVEGGFWFDDVKFELLRSDADRLGGPVNEQEMSRIRSMAASEVRIAYSGLRITFSDNHGAFYRVRVVQELNRRAAGESNVLPPLGGLGAVSFLTLAGSAIKYASPGADRAAVIDGIGRGIGRAAAHEFAHQILPHVDIHASRDDHSYDYETSDRAAQYYGPMHWDIAWPSLLKTLGQ
jgi:hypothetical protein